MAEWRIYLDGTAEGLEALRISCSEPPWTVIVEHGRHRLISSALASATDGDTALRLAEELLNQFSSLVRFLNLSIPRVHVAAVESEDADGTPIHMVWSDCPVGIEFGSSPALITIDDMPVQSGAGVCAMTFLGLTANPKLAEAMRLFLARSEDWTQLCNVVDLVRDAIGSGIPDSWAPKKRVELLKRTAQSRETAGDTARHVRKPGWRPPRQPMNLSGAQGLVRHILTQAMVQQTRMNAAGSRERKSPS